MFKLTDTMVLAIFKKGIDYEAKNAEMEFEVPLDAFSLSDEPTDKKMVMKFKIESFTLKISQD